MFQGLMRSVAKLCQLRGVAVRSLATSSSNTFIRDKSYVNGKWVSACSGKIFDGEMSLCIFTLCNK